MRGEGAELVEREYQSMDYPGVFEHEVREALGVWLADYSTCTDAEFRAEVARQFATFMRGCPPTRRHCQGGSNMQLASILSYPDRGPWGKAS
jgi:hypothetical protein